MWLCYICFWKLLDLKSQVNYFNRNIIHHLFPNILVSICRFLSKKLEKLSSHVNIRLWLCLHSLTTGHYLCCDDVGPSLPNALLLRSPSFRFTSLESNYTCRENFRYICLTFIGRIFVWYTWDRIDSIPIHTNVM